jgi:hypothetical protein
VNIEKRIEEIEKNVELLAEAVEDLLSVAEELEKDREDIWKIFSKHLEAELGIKNEFLQYTSQINYVLEQAGLIEKDIVN